MNVRAAAGDGQKLPFFVFESSVTRNKHPKSKGDPVWGLKGEVRCNPGAVPQL